MMKANRMPTVTVLLMISWLIAFLGIVTGGLLIILKFSEFNFLLIGLSVLLSAALLSALIRMLGNIGQQVFEIRNSLFDFYRNDSYFRNQQLSVLKAQLTETQDLNQSLKTRLQAQLTETQDLNQSLKTRLQAQAGEISYLRNVLDQIVCDTKDLNQNINQIKTFFEQIEKHLALKQ